jgi:NitT/TauT family transport system permease protein
MLLLLAIWEIGGRALNFPLIPPASTVLESVGRLLAQERFQADIALTLTTLVAGFIPAVIVGVGVGVLMARYPSVEAALDPYVNVFISTPVSAILPLLVLIVGQGIVTRAVVVFLFAVWVILIATLNGIKATDRSMIEMARSFGADDQRILRRIAVPYALPLILGGIRIGIGRAVGGALLAEIVTTLSGIGGRLVSFGGAFRTADVYAVVLLTTLFAFLLTEIVHRSEQRLGRWRQI